MHNAQRAAVVALVLLSSPGPHAQPAPSQNDCRGVTLLAAFARIYGTVDVEAIERKTLEICRPTGGVRLRWPNGTPMKSAGQWRYPNGAVASASAGTWRYPNGKTARSAQRAWLYPDGESALSVAGQWRTPYGTTVSLQGLRAWSRDRLPPAVYTALDGRIGAGGTDEEVVAALELAWRAR